MPSPILARADALMQRRRQTLGGNENIPVLTDAIGADDDIPVLLDREPPAGDSPATQHAGDEHFTHPEANNPTVSPVLDYEHLMTELALRVNQRLQAEIPRLIELTVRELLAEQTTAQKPKEN